MKVVVCPKCKGTGERKQAIGSIAGPAQEIVNITCETCKGLRVVEKYTIYLPIKPETKNYERD